MASQYRVVIANSIEEFHPTKSRFANECYQLEKAPFWGKTEVLYDSALTMSRRSIQCTLLERGRAPTNLRVFTFHSKPHCYVRNGISFDSGDVSASRSGDSFITFLRKGCTYHSLMVNDGFANKLLSFDEVKTYRDITGDNRSIVIKQSPEFPFTVDLIDNIFNALAVGSLQDADERSLRGLQVELLRNLVLLIGSAGCESMRTNSNHRLLDKASKIVMATRVKSLSVEELAKRVGTSRRNLEHIFQTIVGLPPKQFLQNVRLNRVREALLSENHVSVIGIAKRHGINHMGHFSAAYKTLFGELPSETQARAAAMAVL